MKKLFSSYACMVSVACLFALPLTFLLSDESEQKEDLSYKAFSEPFIQTAKKASRGVVSIKTHIKASQDRQSLDDQNGPSPDEFWERFFGFPPFPGMPRHERRPEQIFGSGFIVSSDGYILTNNHMIENGSKILVQFLDGHELEAKKIGGDPATDIALIKVDAKDLPALTLADSSKVDIGEWVMAIGNPLGLRTSVTTGIISAKGRSDLDIALVEEFFQTDATINRGNSGGPLVNLHGDVVGMNTAIATTTGGYMGICFAISSNLLRDVMKELIEHGKLIRGFIGVSLQPIDNELASALGLETPHGALVADVLKKSPSEVAGLQSGDVILKVNGVDVDTAGGLKKLIALMRPDQKVELTILRSRAVQTVSVTIGKAPEEESRLVDVQNSFGMSLEPITADIAKKYELTSTAGLLVVQIDPLGQAYEAGIRPGHVILAVNGTSVSTVEEFSENCAKVEKGKKILLQVRVGKHLRYVPLTTE